MPYKDPEKARENTRERMRLERQVAPEKQRERSRRHRAAHRDEINARQRAKYWADPETARQRQRDQKRSQYQREPEKFKARARQTRHGLRADDFSAMWDAQEGRCYLCSDPLPRISKQVHIDHDHTCCPPHTSCAACRRGLACHSCNALIGHAQDDPDRLERIAANLRVAVSAARQRIAGKPRQEELPPNVRPLRGTG